MKTPTIKDNRAQSGHWLKQALAGEDVGFVLNGRVVALRPVDVHSADYALQEYGLTEKAQARAARRIKSSIASEQRCGTVKSFTGKLHDLRN